MIPLKIHDHIRISNHAVEQYIFRIDRSASWLEAKARMRRAVRQTRPDQMRRVHSHRSTLRCYIDWEDPPFIAVIKEQDRYKNDGLSTVIITVMPWHEPYALPRPRGKGASLILPERPAVLSAACRSGEPHKCDAQADGHYCQGASHWCFKCGNWLNYCDAVLENDGLRPVNHDRYWGLYSDAEVMELLQLEEAKREPSFRRS